MILTETRKAQLQLAHRALDKGDKAKAQAIFFEGIGEFLHRLDKVLARTDLPTLPMRQRDSQGWRDKLEACRIAREQVRQILTRKPDLSTPQIAARVGCSEDLVRGVRSAMGLITPVPALGRDLRKRYERLLADNPQINNKEAAYQLECSTKSISAFRRKMGFAYKPRRKPQEPRNE